MSLRVLLILPSSTYCPLPLWHSAYIGFPVFFLFAAFWKWKEGDETVPFAKMDLISGKNEIDEEEKAYLAAQQLLGPRPKWKKLWDAL